LSVSCRRSSGLEFPRILRPRSTLRYRVSARRSLSDVVQPLPKTRAALAYAEHWHAGQRRAADGAPFILHPLEVAELLYSSGAPDHVIAAGLLHDVIEKTAAPPDELWARFGERVAKLVLAVTEDPEVNDFVARKAALRHQVASAGEEALTVFAADKISKVRELRISPAFPSSRSGAGKVSHYEHSLRLLEERLPWAPLVAQLRGELESLPAAAIQHRPTAGDASA
jgi:HD domain